MMRTNYLRLLLVIFLFAITMVTASCLAGSSEPTVKKFIEKCQTGDWSGAEVMLSERGKMLYAQSTTLRDSFWPILGMGISSGYDANLIKTQMPNFVIFVSTDDETRSAQARVKINNSALIGESATRSILGQTGLKTIDLTIKIDLVQEMNRWKIERITPQVDQVELAKWEAYAKTSPTDLTGNK